MSGATIASGAPALALGAITKPCSSCGSLGSALTRSTIAIGGGLSGQALEERLDGLARPLDLELDTLLVVAHPTSEPQFAGQAIDVWAKADALHRPVHPRSRAHTRPLDARSGRLAQPVLSNSSRSTCHALACASWMRGMCSERVTITWSARRSDAIWPPP